MSGQTKGSVVVTGASTGIGWAVAQVLTGRGFHVFGSVRKAADAERLTAAFGEAVTPLVFDVTDEAAVREAARTVEATLDEAPPGGPGQQRRHRRGRAAAAPAGRRMAQAAWRST